jgi:circadian clock protein KaiB
MPTAGTSSVTKLRTKAATRAKSVVRSLRLYVAGNAPNSLRAISNAQAICQHHPGSPYDLEIVDVLEHPKRALADGIIVTPTLIKVSPLPSQRMVGNLSDTQQVLLTLGAK